MSVIEKKLLWVLGVTVLILTFVGSGVYANKLINTDNKTSRDSVDWYYFDWMANAEYAPVFQVLDTESSLGPYAEHAKTITLKDLVKMHGHPCDGLIMAACGIKLAMDEVYPDGVIDRTDTCCITNNSPCFGDVAAYLTGARIRFGTQKIDPGMKIAFVIYRPSTKQAVRVSLKDGVFPSELAQLERKIKSGNFTREQMRKCQKLGWVFAKELISRPLTESFTVERIEAFDWKPDDYINAGSRGDIINKNANEESSSEKPKLTVKAYYFHRTLRCQTCLAIETEADRIIQENYSQQLSDGSLDWVKFNLDDPGGKEFEDKFGLSYSSLVLVKIRGEDYVGHRKLEKTWELIKDKPAFDEYVSREVGVFLNER